MVKWLLVFVLIFLIGTFYLYQFAGLRQYLKSVKVIKTMTPVEDRVRASNEFYGTDSRGAKHGIFAGVFLNRIWVWTGGSLKSYKTDQYTVYSWFDGCSDEIRAKLNQGEPDAIPQTIYTDMQGWQKRIRVGDYVTLYLTGPENGGVAENLREIYDYNFWLYMGKGIDTECEK